MNADAEPIQIVVCVKNDHYPASLEVGKIYRAIPDPVAKRQQKIRLIDESGEDYLYPLDYFELIDLPFPRFQAMLQQSRESIRAGKGLTEEEFWSKVEQEQ